MVLGVAQALEKVPRPGVGRPGALLEQRVLRHDHPVLGEVVEDQTDDEARHGGDADERDEDARLESQRGQQPSLLALGAYETQLTPPRPAWPPCSRRSGRSG